MSQDAADFYSENVEKEVVYSDRDKREAVKELRERFLEELETGDEVLDIGCVPGMDTDFFESHGMNATGIDLGERCIGYAKENFEGSFELIDMRDLEFDEESFAGIWCFAAIHFLEPPKMFEALKEFSRVLKEDGIAMITFKIGEGKVIREKYDGEVEQYLVSEEFARDLLEDNDLKILWHDISKGPTHSFGNFITRKTR